MEVVTGLNNRQVARGLAYLRKKEMIEAKEVKW
jgi:hypothetical protein